MAKRRPMSKAETGIAKVLWQLGRATARQVHDELRQRKQKIDYTTVQTYLNRLEDKGYVTSRMEGRAKSFAPKVSPARVIGEAVDDFVTGLFDGNAFPLMQHLIEERGVTHDDIAKLKAMLKDLEKESK